jgi:hypothetical protein
MRATNLERIIVLWACPKSWKLTAELQILEHFRESERKKDELKKNQQKKTEARSPSRARKRKIPIHNYQHNTFRNTFFQAIGHQYVMEMMNTAINPSTGKIFNEYEFRIKLGVDKSQLSRWLREDTFADGNKFFAMQLLILNSQIKDLNISDNDNILQMAFFSMLRWLKRTYDQPYSPIMTRSVFEKLYLSMLVMNEQPAECLYNPRDESLTAADCLKALESLSSIIKCKYNRSYLPSAICETLDCWGLAYSLFALGYRKSWKQCSSAI